ncbi:putative mitotic spindle biogenesis protein [Golovinomyces cichoracearum]|uniref:Putative mitotic spindle biogenesis protein n=1 Tax=Golovinomyces cichoracearum TaxID=62708 RepID=A0A420GH38_9PEZI|nr:putative mitotic spindle biogenesis protein [Golovinomyces cichoracearum]
MYDSANIGEEKKRRSTSIEFRENCGRNSTGYLFVAYHYELTPSSTLIEAQKSLAVETKTAITTLLSRGETYIAKLERKQQILQARSELLGGRLEGIRISSTGRKVNRSHDSSMTARSYDH